MANLEPLRRRLPLIVFVLLAVVVLMLLGLACLTEDPMQAIERALSFVPALAALTEPAWAALLALLAVSLLVVVQTSAAKGRASPALLQRFRF